MATSVPADPDPLGRSTGSGRRATTSRPHRPALSNTCSLLYPVATG